MAMMVILRTVTVKGPRGSLVKSFKHLALDIYMVDKETIKVISNNSVLKY